MVNSDPTGSRLWVLIADDIFGGSDLVFHKVSRGYPSVFWLTERCEDPRRTGIAGLPLRSESLRKGFPEVGESRGAADRILHHPPVAQAVEDARAGSGSVGRATPGFVGADVGVPGGQQ